MGTMRFRYLQDDQEQRIQVLVSYSRHCEQRLTRSPPSKRMNIDVSGWDVEMIFSMGEALPDATFDALTDIFGFRPVRSLWK